MNKSVRVGILGCARIAKAAVIDAAALAPEIEISAAASRSEHAAAAYAAAHGIPKAYGSYERLLEDGDIDAVYVPLPNSLHGEWASRALLAGKAVLCEKPLASNAREAEALVQIARSGGRPLVEAFHYRYHPLARFLEEILREGRLGKVCSVYASLEVPGNLVPTDDIRFQYTLAGGALMDVGAYCVNALRHMTGEDPIPVSATAELVAPGVDGAMRAEVRFGSGAVGELRCSLIAPRFNSVLRVKGLKGRVLVKNPFLPQMGHKFEMEIEGERSERDFGRTPTYVYQAREFAAVVRGEASVLTTAEDGVANMRAIDSIYAAAGLSPRLTPLP